MRNRTMFAGPGLAYVYISYGVHRLLNVVCEPEGVGSAVLIRALRPLEGIDLMERRRGRTTHLCSGPGRLTQALGIGTDRDGADLTGEPLRIAWAEEPDGEMISTTRIGITRAIESPWRYLVLDDPNVSVRPKSIVERGLRRK